MILVVDNYDSFAYNLVQYVGEALGDRGADPASAVAVRRNDAVDAAGIRDLDPDGIVVSPGPGTPEEAGVSTAVFADLSYPALGVCLGHQALCAANGAPVGPAEAVVHGKPSTVAHDGRGLFGGLPERIDVGRYHSLSVARDDLPASLVETAWTVDRGEGGADGSGRADERTASASGGDGTEESRVVMGVRHRERPHVGVQFHPESILTDHGRRFVGNFVQRCCTA